MSINHQSENIPDVQNGFQKTKIGIIKGGHFPAACCATMM